MIYNTHSVNGREEWHSILSVLHVNQILQSWDWGELKSRYGWELQRIVWQDSQTVVAAAQILTRSEIRYGIKAKIMYVPRGPVLDWNNTILRQNVLEDLRKMAIREKALFIKIDPYLPVGYGVEAHQDEKPDDVGLELVDELTQSGWEESNQQIQFRNTMVLDLTTEESELLLSFSQKTRYNIRLASRKGLEVRDGTSADLNLLYGLYESTAVRNGFAIRPRKYYIDVWQSFMEAGMAQPLVVTIDDEVIAAVVMSVFGGCATYMYGMSSGQHTEKMPNYLLQWESIVRAKASGCTSYDFWGVPEVFVDSDPLWGVWRFKSGFKGDVVRTLGAWDFSCKRFGYWLYANVMPSLLRIMQMRGS